jgi:hypothetical protein
MPAGSTYSTIATYTASGSPTSYTFSSIPSTYTDLVLVASGTNTSSMLVQFNGDTGSNYSYTYLWSQSGAASGRGSNAAFCYVGEWGSTTGATTIINFNSYASTSVNKTVMSRNSDGFTTNGSVGAYISLWRNTAAINAIKIYGASSFGTGTVLTLYGIAAA